jgi:hypothetical protein
MFSETEIDLKPALRGVGGDKEIRRLISLAVAIKPEGHDMRVRETWLNKTRKSMSKIGG